jgi:hypothetical protein
MPRDKEPIKEQVVIGDGYPTFQLAKALKNIALNLSPQAEKKAEQWEKVLSGLYSAELQIGVRTPVFGTPAWATLEVVTGGFATGNLLAGGALTDVEKDLAQEINIPIGPDTRALLNSYFISQEGVERLCKHASSGQFTVNLPEEGALLAVACLLEKDDVPSANTILSQIFPYFAELRFFPHLSGAPPTSSESVFLQPVSVSINKLKGLKANRRIASQEEAIKVWIPLYDSLVSLLIETVDGAIPSIAVEKSGKPVRSASGQFELSGGWPGRKFPTDWADRAQRIVKLHQEKASQHSLCKMRLKNGTPHMRLLKVTQLLIEDPMKLSEGDRQYTRLQLARYVAKRGLPDSDRMRTYRDRQDVQCGTPKHYEIAEILRQRLMPLPQEQGLENVSPFIAPVSSGEATDTVPEGTQIPQHLAKKVGRAQLATVDELIQQGYITSTDVLAEVLPQITSCIRASSFTDVGLKKIYVSVYRAFCRRRSLLLLNLEAQVKIAELPWISGIEKYRKTTMADKELAIVVLTDVVALALSHFPHALLPNKLLQEIRALVKQAGLEAPIVDEVAADIFMGEFTQKYAEAATIAAELLHGSLYERYYDIDYSAFLKKRLFLKRTVNAQEFSRLCSDRASPGTKGWSVASNGIVIEQQHILTTQNLAVLFQSLDLKGIFRWRLFEMVKDTFSWICKRQQLPVDHYHAGLIMLKNTAYAWRQMVFYMSLLQVEEQKDLLLWMYSHLVKQDAYFRNRFEPVMTGLKSAVIDSRPLRNESDGLRFLGWAVDRHPLMPAKFRDNF